VSRALLYGEIAKRAEATRRADETPEGAFARSVTTDDDGRALFAAYKIAGGEDYRPAPSATMASHRSALSPRSTRRTSS
jgi:hypothetical protein